MQTWFLLLVEAGNLEEPEYLNALGVAMLCCKDKLVHEN